MCLEIENEHCFFLITYYNYKLKQNPFFIVPSLTNYLGWYYLTLLFLFNNQILFLYYFILASYMVLLYELGFVSLCIFSHM